MNVVQMRILECVRKGFTTRKAISEQTGMQKGFAAVMGAPTKGKPAKGTLLGDGLLRATKAEEGGGWVYELTASGKKALNQCDKSQVADSLHVRVIAKAKPAKAAKKAAKKTAKKKAAKKAAAA